MNEYSISMYLSVIERDYNYLMNKELRKYNLGKHDIRVLREINANDGLSQNEVGAILKEDKITISKAVKNLVAQGFVEKVKDLEDKRITRLNMTEKGRADRVEMLKSITMANEILVRDFSDEDKIKLLELLKCVSGNIHDEAIRIKDE